MFLVPKEEKFFDHFEQLADKIEKGGQLFLDILDNYEHSEAKVSTLKEIEHEADKITHQIYAKMHQTFLTPLDREDIYALANKMDSILDIIEASAVRLYLYKVKTPVNEIRELALILIKAIALVKIIVHALRNKKNSEMAIKTCVEINTLENEGDYIMRQAIARLFEREKDAVELIKQKEILERVEEGLDTCEDVSNIVEGIILKHG
jgi:predicted phosphate transport protein (TIGR00153 family)